jgi:lipoprotein NlpD
MRAAARRALRATKPLVLALALASCIGTPMPWQDQDYYAVRTGDTLFSIASRNGVDYRDLARWNGIDNPTLIYPGQRLRLYAPGGQAARPAPSTPSAPARTAVARAPAAPPPQQATRTPAPPPRAVHRLDWRWPATGAVVARFGDSGSVGKGIDISGRVGDDVVAAAAGRVVYAGSGLLGYGKLIIIKHDETYLSAYGHNDMVLVGQGADVRAGERVATMGLGPGKRPLLHFEIRIDGKPVDPLLHLPPR